MCRQILGMVAFYTGLAFEKVAYYRDEELNLDHVQIVLRRRLLYDQVILNFNLQYYSEDLFTD